MSTKPRVRYRLRIPEPSRHRVRVSMEIDDAPEGGVLLAMPVWTPGSYLVREYARHVSEVVARRASGDEVPVEKVDKCTWRVDTKPGKRVDVSFTVYANELTVRTSHVDADHAFLHPAGTWLYVVGREGEPSSVEIEPPEGWKVATQLPLVGENRWAAEDLDALIDAPIEIGPHGTHSFEVLGVPHRIAIHGEGNYDPERLLSDTHAICLSAAEIFENDHPCDAYTFIYHVVEGAGGGLEHTDSSVCGFSPFSFRPERSYVRALALIAHEYFHLWNVKRIRPRELGPFDYLREVYTRQLWVAEGVTSYYMDLIVRRAELTTVANYLDDLSRMIRACVETPGRLVDPVSQASFDAWIKLYRPHENSRNATVSYYLKGALIALLLDLTIRDETDGKRSLDDVMRGLWAGWRARPEEGFTEEELLGVLEEAAGRSLAPEIESWVHSTEELPFDERLAKVGLELAPRSEDGDERAWLGVTTKAENGKTVVREVLADSPAEAGGLDAADEIVALDGWRIGDLPERLKDRAPGEEIELTVARRGRLRTLSLTPSAPPATDRVLRPVEGADERAKRLFEGWLGAPFAAASEKPDPVPPDRRPRPV